MFSLRSAMPTKIKKYLDVYGGQPLKTITIVRTPVVSIIQKILNLVSNGGYNATKQKYKYDDVFHLYMIFYYEDPNIPPVRFDKNEIVQMNVGGLNDGGERMSIDAQKITPSALFFNANRVAGYHLWDYTPDMYNCQNFVITMLKSSNLLTPEVQKFVLQDAPALIASLPSAVGTALVTITNIASWFRSKILGQGVRRRRRHRKIIY